LVFWTIDAQIGTFTSFSLSLNFVRKILYSVMVLLDKAHRFFLLFLYRILIEITYMINHFWRFSQLLLHYYFFSFWFPHSHEFMLFEIL
jgi:hypothetical protein